MKTLRVSLTLDVDDEAVKDIRKAFEQHVDYLIDCNEWPEIKSIYDVKSIVVSDNHQEDIAYVYVKDNLLD